MTLEEIEKEIAYFKKSFEESAAMYAFLKSDSGRARKERKIDELVRDGVDDIWAEMIVEDEEYSLVHRYESDKRLLEEALRKRDELLSGGTPGKK